MRTATEDRRVRRGGAVEGVRELSLILNFRIPVILINVFYSRSVVFQLSTRLTHSGPSCGLLRYGFTIATSPL